ncbi:MAG: IPT/TIG domain-containing protein [Ignavibacteriales bacterium]|nr:IPT/TIG domain-containing protein [Ignavibacteriales bacterium]
MKKQLFKTFILTILLAFASLIYFVGCSDEVSPSLYSNSSDAIGATPEITSVDPPNAAIAAVTTITIAGKNFLSDTSSVKVYFGKKPGTILTASPTQLTVVSPNVWGSLKIKISINSAVPYSNTYDYVLQAAAKDYYPDKKDITNKPTSVIVDKMENVFSYNSTIGVVQITPDSVSSVYSTKGGETYWTTMRFGTNGVLYGVRGLQAIFSIPAGGGVKNSSWVALAPSSLKISKIDFDPLGNLWAAGKNANIYRIKQDKSYIPFPFDYNVTAMRVFINNGITYLYVAAQLNSRTTIMRLPIDANGDLGTPETYFDFSENYGANFIVNDLTFAADGEMYLATDLPSPIVYVNSDKSNGLLYSGILLESPALSFAWGNGNFLYYVRSQMTDANGVVVLPPSVVKLNMLKPGAPYYGM